MTTYEILLSSKRLLEFHEKHMQIYKYHTETFRVLHS